jgi:hypothetical protein
MQRTFLPQGGTKQLEASWFGWWRSSPCTTRSTAAGRAPGAGQRLGIRGGGGAAAALVLAFMAMETKAFIYFQF